MSILNSGRFGMGAVAGGRIRKLIGKRFDGGVHVVKSRTRDFLSVEHFEKRRTFSSCFSEYASEYATQREQFKRKLSTFGQIQVIRHSNRLDRTR